MKQNANISTSCPENSAVQAMQVLQNEMRGEAERAGLTSDEAVVAFVRDFRQAVDSTDP